MKKRFFLLIIFVPIMLFSLTAFYWLKIKDNLEFSYRVLSKIHQLQLSDQNIDLVVFSDRAFINYDELVLQVKSFDKQLKYFKQELLNNTTNLIKFPQNIFLPLQKEFNEKEFLLEDFKSSHSVWLNSIRFLISIHENRETTDGVDGQVSIHEPFNELISIIALKSSWKELYSERVENILKLFKAEFEKNRSSEIIFSIYIHTKKLVELSREIDIIISKLKDRKVSSEISILKADLIDRFEGEKRVQDFIFYILIIASALFFIFLIIFLLKEKRLESELKILNEELHNRVEHAVQENRRKDKIMFQQSKLASMGEMIGNIAHQWRQPLNSISIIVQDYESAYEFDELDSEYLKKNREDAMELIDYMSKTIDDFRNFFRESSEKEVFSVHSVVSDSIKIVESSLKRGSIKLDIKLGVDSSISGVRNQYIQVLINLLKNAQDILIEHCVENPKIEIESFLSDNKYILSVHDNGGGVPDNIIDKIFEPYFSTKHQSTGTGIGLYMSKIIVETNFSGKLRVENIDQGATFFIETPISL